MGGSTPQKRSTNYRYDLDGLRGFAIALVVLFHIFVGRVSGGVDVFLLLSGYFFLGSQLRYALRPNPNLNPWWPIWRTIRRLLPALALVIAVTAVLVLTLTPGLMDVELARQFTASLLYYQNWELAWQEADYAAASQDTSPLQHLWSMSVQGQFYLAAILFGVLLAALCSRRVLSREATRWLAVAVLSVITVASFAWASRHGFFGTGDNYYSTFSRAWELTLGGLLALLPPSVRIPHRVSGFTAGLGVVAIAITGVVIADALAFPGPLALLPLAGAALVILSDSSNPVSSVLSSRPARWLGETAYALYLWHWPLLIILTVFSGNDTPPWWIGLIVIAVSLGLAHMTHQLVEKPLRQHAKRPKADENRLRTGWAALRTRPGATRATGGVVVAALSAGVLAVQPYWASQIDNADEPLDVIRYPGALVFLGAEAPEAPPMPDPSIVSSIFPPIANDGCMLFIGDAPDAMPHSDCVYGDEDAETTIVLAGGSHVEPLGIPLDVLGKEYGFKFVPFIRQECPIVVDYDDAVVSDECTEWSQNVMAEIVDMQPDLVISTSTRPEGSAGGAEMSVDHVPDSYLEVWGILADAGIPFLGLRDNPWMFDPSGERLDPNLCLASGGSIEECSMPREAAYEDVDPAAEHLDGADNQWSVDTSHWYCPEDLCLPAIGNVTVYRDQNHISNAYALSLAPLLWMAIEPVFDELGVNYDEEGASAQ
ncbi:acyltransferase family protein [Corynebacterium timonense]|uniref:Peptidoglycan/LPS O-acetylase OafA/YrhL, contains acyltransferase and SGNH-hydrolase domains n=1 Tax=Corynebacterium timonense TaxID=441500 RepID=A0A1H1MXK8_9CORY|nr:acyltransferase family protein [Corynebacterium timonense]SDR91338.1 Peptidoglycan/LPS O-acetylase OafA/YrhL, contains acyltransferase and SGNH-hydrolase domains [Corynebacterium timonense]